MKFNLINNVMDRAVQTLKMSKIVTEVAIAVLEDEAIRTRVSNICADVKRYAQRRNEEFQAYEQKLNNLEKEAAGSTTVGSEKESAD